CLLLFFFQAEDGIRDWSVTGVQTCALPISAMPAPVRASQPMNQSPGPPTAHQWRHGQGLVPHCSGSWRTKAHGGDDGLLCGASRSEERRVGKEGRKGGGQNGSRKKERVT